MRLEDFLIHPAIATPHLGGPGSFSFVASHAIADPLRLNLECSTAVYKTDQVTSGALTSLPGDVGADQVGSCDRQATVRLPLGYR